MALLMLARVVFGRMVLHIPRKFSWTTIIFFEKKSDLITVLTHAPLAQTHS